MLGLITCVHLHPQLLPTCWTLVENIFKVSSFSSYLELSCLFFLMNTHTVYTFSVQKTKPVCGKHLWRSVSWTRKSSSVFCAEAQKKMRSWIRQMLTVYQEKETCNTINVRYEHVAARVVEDSKHQVWAAPACDLDCQLRPTGCLLKYQSGTDLVQCLWNENCGECGAFIS